MKDFEAAKELFKDSIHTNSYFDSMSAVATKNKIEEVLKGEQEIPLVFLLGERGVGKSFIIKLIHDEFSQNNPSALLEYPLFEKKDLLEMFDDNKHFSISPTLNVFIDEAHFLNESQLKIIRSLIDTRHFRFILSLSHEEDSALFATKQFSAYAKVIIEHGTMEENETLRFIQNSLDKSHFKTIASLFSKSEAKAICRYAQGNFRVIKKYLYTLMKLLAYAQKHGLARYQKINSCLLTMTALELGLIDD